MHRRKILTYVLSVTALLLFGYLGTFFTAPSIPGWYSTLAKPSFNPPNWIFGPVWTALFILIGISLGMVIASPRSSRYRTSAIVSYAVQLILNIGWSYLFFYLHRPDLAAAEIILLLVSIIINIYYAGRVRRAAAWLLLPYSLWVAFASILNIAIWRLNQ